MLFVIDVTDEVESIFGGIKSQPAGGAGKGNKGNSAQGQIDIGRKMIHRIMAEEEMSSVHTLAIVLNCKETSQLY